MATRLIQPKAALKSAKTKVFLMASRPLTFSSRIAGPSLFSFHGSQFLNHISPLRAQIRCAQMHFVNIGQYLIGHFDIYAGHRQFQLFHARRTDNIEVTKSRVVTN